MVYSIQRSGFAPLPAAELLNNHCLLSSGLR